MPNQHVIPLAFDTEAVRVVMINNVVWFVLADLCRVLEIVNSHDVPSRLREHQKGVATIDTLGGPQQMTVVNESGVYATIFQSRKPIALRFQDWVTSEVLPSIRATGAYSIEQYITRKEHDSAIKALNKTLELKLNLLRADMQQSHNITLTPRERALEREMAKIEREEVKLVNKLRIEEHWARLENRPLEEIERKRQEMLEYLFAKRRTVRQKYH